MVGEPKPEHPLPHRRPPLSRRQLLMQVVVAAVILASGMGIGAGGTILALQDRIIWHIPTPPPDRGDRPPRPPGNMADNMVGMLRTQYSLSDEQVEKVKTLFAARLEATRARWKELNTAEQAEREKLVEDMKPILTPEQYEKWSADYQKMMDDMRNRPFWGPRGDRRGPPHGDRGPGRPMGGENRRGNWPPRGPADPNAHHRQDRSSDRPKEFKMEFNTRPGDVNTPK